MDLPKWDELTTKEQRAIIDHAFDLRQQLMKLEIGRRIADGRLVLGKREGPKTAP